MEVDTSKSLAELVGASGSRPDHSSGLTSACLKLYHKPLQDFTVQDVRLMIGQNVGLEFLIPIAIERLQKTPFVEGDYYPGDLLKVVLQVSERFWEGHEDLYWQVSEIGAGLPSVMMDLIQAINRFESLQLAKASDLRDES